MAGIAALAIGYVLSQFFRSFMAVLTPVLTDELGMSKVDLSAASGAWFIAFALSQFAVGVSLDRYGPRLTASVMLAAGAAGGAALFAVATQPWMVIAAMGLIGIGCAPILMAALFLFARNFPPQRFAVLASWTIAFGTAGNVAGTSPLAWAADMFGWRAVMVGLGVLTLAVALAMFLLVEDPERPEGEAPSAGLGGYLTLIKYWWLWPIFPIASLNYAPTTGIRGLWAGPFLADVYGAGAILIGHATFFMALAMVAGAFAYGPLDVLFKTRKWVAMWGNAAGVVVLAALAVFPTSGIVSVTALLVLVGLTGGSFGLIMAHARAFVPPHLTGRGVTLMNFFSIGGVGLMQLATGWVVTESQVPGDPAAAYSTLFWFYAGMLTLALLVYSFSRDARPEN